MCFSVNKFKKTVQYLRTIYLLGRTNHQPPTYTPTYIPLVCENIPIN